MWQKSQNMKSTLLAIVSIVGPASMWAFLNGMNATPVDLTKFSMGAVGIIITLVVVLVRHKIAPEAEE